MRFSPELVKDAFCRLRANMGDGKVIFQERTSALMYFLAYDAFAGNRGALPFDPDTVIGKGHRDGITREYSRLVVVRNHGPKGSWWVHDLGRVIGFDKSPERGISSNFLTVPLKKASAIATPVEYPSRRYEGRPVPLLRLGNSLGAGQWAIDRHPSWPDAIPVYLAERVTGTPFTDLAIFVLRDAAFEPSPTLQETLGRLLAERFSTALSEFWSRRIRSAFEVQKISVPDPWYVSEYHNTFDDEGWFDIVSHKASKEHVSELETRVRYLEQILTENGIVFERG